MTLREKLIVLRDKSGISQMALAHQLGVSRQAVSRWESGDVTPTMDKLKALAKIYDVSLDWLCSDTADGKSLEEVVAPVEDNGTSNATTSAENKKKIRYAVIALVAGVAILACMWLAMRPKNVFVKRKCEQKGPKKVSTFSTRFHVVSNVFPKYQMLTF